LLRLAKGVQEITPVSAGSVRVRYSYGPLTADPASKPCIADLPSFSEWEYEEDETGVLVKLPDLQIRIDRETNRFLYYDGDGRLLVRERPHRSKELTEIPVYRLAEGSSRKETVQTADGVKEVVREAAREQVGTAYHTRLHLDFAPDEALYGLGQHEEGFHSLRGNCVYLNQANRTVAIPVLVSVRGYGFFFDTGSPAIFNDTPEGSYFYTEADPEMDYFFMNGGDMDGVVREMRRITGKAVMLPRWAFGYLQSQERYETQEEILSVAKRYREEGIGLDCIVLDWMSWPDGQWGQKTFDAERFPDPDAMTAQLHAEHVHFMISVWPNMDEKTANYREFKDRGLLLPEVSIYNALDPAARALYWKQAQEGLFAHGVDAWWCDNSEPVCPEWMETVRPENAKNYEQYCAQVSDHLPATLMNAYGLFHARGIYEGQRSVSEKRVVNLTRSSSPGGQRYGTILWSGDISASWETLKKQIATSLHFAASGMPYWTLDIGAFFVKNGTPWYWDGEYDRGAEDPAYCELFTRWYQWGAFLPIFRGHGTDVRRELWVFDRPEAPFYQALLAANRRRYAWMPYIYSLAGGVCHRDGLMIRPLAFRFPGDRNTWEIFDQYLFGDAVMICPVTEAMLFREDGPADRCIRRVYLPEGTAWYDLYTDKKFPGGQWIDAEAPLDRIPVFVRAGALIPMTEPALSVEELSGEITLHIYPGADGSFDLYEDAGDGYRYESGDYTWRHFVWHDRERTLTEDGKKPSVRYIVHP
ncbi:MAG: DUF5110 domain-containing protein, partial [Lachnospiraceae bacterium]|nr:DUF5110 domain-containing protein [Lachnospiraceae bacterium]